MMELVVNGTPYTDFIDVSATIALDSLANEFEFTASAVDAYPPFKTDDKVEVYIDGELSVTGYIEESNGSDQEGSHVVSYSGRDLTGDIVDSSIDKLNDIRATGNLSLIDIIKKVIANLNSSVEVVGTYTPKPFNAAEDIVTPEIGQPAIELMQTYARKRQSLLTSDSLGRINITQSTAIDSGATVQRLTGVDSNNIISQSWAITKSQLFNKYIHRGQLDPRALNNGGATDIATVENQGAEVFNSEVRVGRQRVIVEGESYSSEQLKDRAKWASQLAKSRATRFNCSIKGHAKYNGGLWAINELVQVNSDVANINRKMLVNKVVFSEGEGAPTMTNLEFVERDVYTINDKILSQKPVGELSNAF